MIPGNLPALADMCRTADELFNAIVRESNHKNMFHNVLTLPQASQPYKLRWRSHNFVHPGRIDHITNRVYTVCSTCCIENIRHNSLSLFTSFQWQRQDLNIARSFPGTKDMGSPEWLNCALRSGRFVRSL